MSKFRKFAILAASALFLSGFFISCNSLSDPELDIQKDGKGRVVFKITDAPFPADIVEEANVTVDWIKILKYPSENLDEAPNDVEVILVELEEPATYNLMKLRNGLSVDMAEVDLPSGSYAEIRLHIVDAGIVLKDGTVHALKVPSGDASGLKIKLKPELLVEEGMQTEVLFDFDLSRSFVLRGNPQNNNGFIFKPVVRAVANLQVSAGTISGVVADEDGYPAGNAALTLYKGEEVVTTAIASEEDGFYSFIGILPGSYKLVLEIGDYVEAVDVVVEAGATTIQDFIVSDTGNEESEEEVADTEEDGEEGQDDTGDTNNDTEDK